MPVVLFAALKRASCVLRTLSQRFQDRDNKAVVPVVMDVEDPIHVVMDEKDPVEAGEKDDEAEESDFSGVAEEEASEFRAIDSVKFVLVVRGNGETNAHEGASPDCRRWPAYCTPESYLPGGAAADCEAA